MANDDSASNRDSAFDGNSVAKEEGRSETPEGRSLATVRELIDLRDEFASMRNALIPSPERVALTRLESAEWERDMWKNTCYAIVGLLFLLIFIGRR